MLKRKPSPDCFGIGSHASLLGDNPTHMTKRKRLFRNKKINQALWIPEAEGEMSDLLNFVLQHEEAFQNQYRLASLYADFRQQLELNPEGYHANIAAWTKALSDAARAGVVPMQGNTHDLLNIRAADELARALQHPQYGKPTGLPAVFHEAVQKKEMIPLKDFINSKESIYKTSWIPSPWKVLQWSLRQVGVLGQPQSPDKLGVGNFVVVKNVEVAADEILKKMKEYTSTADRVLSRTDFLKRFSTALNPAAPLTSKDLEILLVFLARDKQAVSYNAQTIKFKPEHEAVPLPVTEEDAAIANLRDTLANINAQIPPLMEKITAAEAAAREAVAAKQMVRAKAALRSKKLAEGALAQRSDVALQLEQVYTDLQAAADQVEIVEAMRAGAAALKGLNEKVGGAEGVQGVVDAVNEQMAITGEITNIMNETSQPLDECEIDNEFEALEKADREKREKEEAEKTAARLAELEEVERRRREKEAADEKQREKNAAEAKQKEVEEQSTEEQVDQASQSMARMSFVQPDDEMEDGEQEKPLVHSRLRFIPGDKELPDLEDNAPFPTLTSRAPSPSPLAEHRTSHLTSPAPPPIYNTTPTSPFTGTFSINLNSPTYRPSKIRAPMQSLRAATSGSRALFRTTTTTTAARRAFSQSKTKQSGHGPSYDPPSGWLFGVKPGEQYEKEGWENVMYWGFGGSCLFGIVAYAFKPDTSIQTWALEEARRRLEVEGILADPDTKKE
ncbi:hypothetical protein EJ02DRAFT_339128 [Clathrospora elynae]|uniref:NADH dehydrogenase [ubiquinone] 1 beta subcomplex subunit 11, mitochondrial n=1 Tax=Clathrospora elynae TaxID=706981 RepID=A0A6A5SXV7_9PLEO|nr:hypothetical protein EJ02DRAFT_339128 [Clathrospora elynae]